MHSADTTAKRSINLSRELTSDAGKCQHGFLTCESQATKHNRKRKDSLHQDRKKNKKLLRSQSDMGKKGRMKQLL